MKEDIAVTDINDPPEIRKRRDIDFGALQQTALCLVSRSGFGEFVVVQCGKLFQANQGVPHMNLFLLVEHG